MALMSPANFGTSPAGGAGGLGLAAGLTRNRKLAIVRGATTSSGQTRAGVGLQRMSSLCTTLPCH
jgi:hypothetical protein